MTETNFILKEGQWLIDLPEYTETEGPEQDLVLDSGEAALLNQLANGRTFLTILASREAFEGADRLEYMEDATPSVGGAYYKLCSRNGREVNQRVWLKDVLLLLLEEFPQTVYFKAAN